MRDAQLNQALIERQMKIRWFELSASCSALMTYPDYRQWWYQQMAAPIVPASSRVDDVPAEVVGEPLPDCGCCCPMFAGHRGVSGAQYFPKKTSTKLTSFIDFKAVEFVLALARVTLELRSPEN